MIRALRVIVPDRGRQYTNDLDVYVPLQLAVAPNEQDYVNVFGPVSDDVLFVD